jgi:hypothetical protein
MLSEVIVKFMPLCNASEGRTLQREMTKAKTWDDCEAVLRECVAIISGDADAQVEDARRSAAIMPAGAARVAAIAAAASMVPGGGPPPPAGRPPGGGGGGAIVPSAAEVAAAVKRTAQEAANTLRTAFEQRLSLRSTAAWLACPESLLLTYNGRGFSLRVDLTAVPPGATVDAG